MFVWDEGFYFEYGLPGKTLKDVQNFLEHELGTISLRTSLGKLEAKKNTPKVKVVIITNYMARRLSESFSFGDDDNNW